MDITIRKAVDNDIDAIVNMYALLHDCHYLRIDTQEKISLVCLEKKL